jgi:hypothetical protein
MSWVDLPREGFLWNGPGGEPQWYNTYPETQRGFCNKCGSSIGAQDISGEAIGVTMTSLDHHDELIPERQSFRDNAVSWLEPLPARA